jgi:tetratricopeptide (TPR) repeat protein
MTLGTSAVAAWGRLGLVVLTVACCLLRSAGNASADPTAREKARAKLVEGSKLYHQGRFKEALSRFEAAQAIFPSAKIFYNLALAYRALGQPARAFSALKVFLRDPGDAAAELVSEAREMSAQLSTKIAFVSVSSDVAGADVLLDGTRVGAVYAPAKLPVDPGRHELTLRTARLGSRSRTFTAMAGQQIELRLEFHSTLSTGAPSDASGRSEEQSGAAQAEALIREARSLREAGLDARAYPLLLKAYETETRPRTAAQLGLVEIQLGYWLDSERHLAEALSSSRDPWVNNNRADLEASLAKARAAVGEIQVTGTPVGATVLVNGKTAGTLPLPTPIRLGEGPANLELRAEGYANVRKSLVVTGGGRAQVAVTMERLSTPGTVEKPSNVSLTDIPAEARDSSHSRGTPKWLRPVAWTSSAAAVASLAFGGYQTMRWRREFNRFEGLQLPSVAGQPPSAPRECGVETVNHGAPGCDGIYKDMQRAKRLAITGYVVGGVLAGAAVAAFVVGSGGSDMELSCAPWSSARGASCYVPF